MYHWYGWLGFWRDFADETVILPLALVMALTLALCGWRRGATGWLIAVFGTLSVLVLSKFTFYTIQSLLPFRLSPSLHAAAGAVVYGSLAALLLRGGRAGPRTALATSGLFAILFGIAQVELRAHTRLEAVVGGLVGIGGALGFVRLAGRMPRSFNRIRLAAALALVLLLVYGHRLSGERLIQSASGLARMAVTYARAAN